jgi:hypothetical protein
MLKGVISAYKSGFVAYLPEFYSVNEVSNRTQKIEDIITKI